MAAARNSDTLLINIIIIYISCHLCYKDWSIWRKASNINSFWNFFLHYISKLKVSEFCSLLVWKRMRSHSWQVSPHSSLANKSLVYHAASRKGTSLIATLHKGGREMHRSCKIKGKGPPDLYEASELACLLHLVIRGLNNKSFYQFSLMLLCIENAVSKRQK